VASGDGGLVKHMEVVEKVRADFIPLVVKTFGVWTLFALKYLNNIVRMLTETTPVVVFHPSWLERIFLTIVILCSYNAKMMHRYRALQGSDDPFPLEVYS